MSSPPAMSSKVTTSAQQQQQLQQEQHQQLLQHRIDAKENNADCGAQRCARAALGTIGAVAAVAASVWWRVGAVDDKIAYAHGLFILSMGFVFFIALTHFWQRLLLETQCGRAFCGRYRLLRSDALEITNKLVSAIQAIASCVAGLMVCTSSCRRSFLTASHYMSDTYAWFGCAYFVYDLWSMYLVHEQKITDKTHLLQLLQLKQQQQQQQQQTTGEALLYDKVNPTKSTLTRRHAAAMVPATATVTTAAAFDRGEPNRTDDQLLDGAAAQHNEQLTDDEVALMLKRLKQVSTTQRPTFLGFCAANPLMTGHHVFLQSFGLLVIVYLRGSFGDCVYGFIYLMEFSTPFVSVRSILSTLQLKKSRAYIINGLAMLGTFFVCRVAMWPWLYYWYGQMVGLNMFQAVVSLPRTCKIGTAILFLPQIYWFYLMMRGAVKVFFPARPRRLASDATDATGGGSSSTGSSSTNSTPTELQQSQHTIH